MSKLHDKSAVPLAKRRAALKKRVQQLTLSVGFLSPAGGVSPGELTRDQKEILKNLKLKLSEAKKELADCEALDQQKN